jgi:hypothetical protein
MESYGESRKKFIADTLMRKKYRRVVQKNLFSLARPCLFSLLRFMQLQCKKQQTQKRMKIFVFKARVYLEEKEKVSLLLLCGEHGRIFIFLGAKREEKGQRIESFYF